MIYSRLYGGLGNQMFQYAVGRALATKHATELVLDTSTLNHFEDKKFYTASLSTYRLDAYRIAATTTTHVDPDTTPIYQERYTDLLFRYDDRVAGLADNVCLDGHHWHSERYFTEVRAELLREFTPARDYSAAARAVAAAIEAAPVAVGIHVRRGDYVTNDYFRKVLGEQSPEYYQRALDYIRERVGKIRVFLFSDDIEWVRTHLDIPAPDDPVYVSRPGIAAWEDQQLLRACDHQVIPNSSFSWWAAWLNDNPDKIVVAPRQWFRVSILNHPDLVPADWVRL
jgi:hypothetical protein